METKQERIILAEFDAEEKLRERNSFSLPELRLFQSTNQVLVNGMDGLMAVMADEGDLLVTKEPLSKGYCSYWNQEIGPLKTKYLNYEKDDSIYRLLAQDNSVVSLLSNHPIINYALVPEYYELCQAIGKPTEEPPLSVVRMLNRKSWSNDLKIRMNLPCQGISVHSVQEFETAVETTMCTWGRVLVKDSMGVSGKGMILLDRPGIARRLIQHFRRQQEEGRTGFDFVLEPLLDKTMDFSCLLTIAPSGAVHIDGLQKNCSKGYAYVGSEVLSTEEYEQIKASGYLETVSRIAGEMYACGYFGPVCIDSMIVSEGKVIPLVEINPRMSMGRFALMLQKTVGKPCRLRYLEGLRTGTMKEEDVLEELKEAGLLYSKSHPSGIVLLAPATWNSLSNEGKRVRIYYGIAYDTEEEYETLSAAWINGCAGRLCAGTDRKKTA